jgi:hypothetical protein
MNQRGFILPGLGSLLPYAGIALAVAVAFGATFWKGRTVGVEATEARLRPLLTACEGTVAALGRQIEAQNAAVAALEAAGKARVEKARAGMEQARSVAQKATREADRLREALISPDVIIGCPAEDAVRVVREGLYAK